MANAPERMQRRHVREKATIDHLVQDVYKPKPSEEQTCFPQSHDIDRLAGRRLGPQGMGPSQGGPSHFLRNDDSDLRRP